MRGIVVCLSALLLASGAVARANVPSPGRGPIFDIEADCSATPPAAYSASGITDDGHEVSVEVAVVLDGVKKGRARKLLAKVASAYTQPNIDIAPVSFHRLALKADETVSGERAKVDGGHAIEQTKSFFGGQRPAGADVVHLLTNKDLTLPTYGSAPAGVAECAGGVQYPDKAFSVSEDQGIDSYSIGPLQGITNVLDAPAEAVAHEIGHLLGGLHEYKSCAEGAQPEDASNRDPSACTIMSDIVDVASLRFSVLESTVIRGYALRFADS